MGECYNPYPKLPKNIRQIGERDPVIRLYMEDYVNTYLKRLQPSGGRDLRVGLLLGEIRTEDGVPYAFVDGAMEMQDVAVGEEKVEFSESVWKQVWKQMEQYFPKRTVLGWFLCGAQGSMLSPLNYWKEHNQYFSAKYQLMYLNSSLEGEEAVYISSEDGFYHLRGHCIYYERNQMMQDYMITRKDARRVESGVREEVIQGFRQKMEDKRLEAQKRTTLSGLLGTACGILSVAVLASGVVMFNNYQKMKEMEAVLTAVAPLGKNVDWKKLVQQSSKQSDEFSDEVSIEEIAANLFSMTEAEESIYTGETETMREKSMEEELTEDIQTDSPQTESIRIENPQTEGMKTEAAKAQQGQNQALPAETKTDTLAVQAPADAVVHIVQEGETLYGICLSRYHNISMLKQICQWNQLEDENRIAVGQKLMLPPVG